MKVLVHSFPTMSILELAFPTSNHSTQSQALILPQLSDGISILRTISYSTLYCDSSTPSLADLDLPFRKDIVQMSPYTDQGLQPENQLSSVQDHFDFIIMPNKAMKEYDMSPSVISKLLSNSGRVWLVDVDAIVLDV